MGSNVGQINKNEIEKYYVTQLKFFKTLIFIVSLEKKKKLLSL